MSIDLINQPISFPHIGNEPAMELANLPPSRMPRVEEPPEPLVSKKETQKIDGAVLSPVSKSPVKFALACVGICLWSLVQTVLLWPLVARLVSYFQHRAFHQAIEAAQIQKLGEALNVVVEGERFGQIARLHKMGKPIGFYTEQQLQENIVQQMGFDADPKQAAEMAKKTIAVQEMIHRLKKEGSTWRLSVAAVRSQIAEIMHMPIYQKVASNPNCLAANFLQCLAVKWIATDANQALRDYGKACLGKEPFKTPGQTFEPKEAADQISRYLNGLAFNADGWGPFQEGRLIWAAAHPLRAIHAISSKTHPLLYDSSKGNPSFSAHVFEQGDKKIHFYFGPGPTGDPLFEFGVLPAYAKCDTFELRFNHQNVRSLSDSYRIEEALRMANDQHFHAVVGFDKIWREDCASPREFFRSYRPFVQNNLRGIEDRKSDNGFFIPEDLLDDRQVELALDKAQEFCERLCVSNDYWQNAIKDKEGRMRMAKMMMLITDTFLTLGMLYRSFDKITPEMIENSLNRMLDQDLMAVRTSGACKQNVDRAVIENLTLRLFFRYANDPSPFSQDELAEIAGAVFGRARIVDNRTIQKRRYQIFDDLLRCLSGCPDKKGLFSAHRVLKDFRDRLSSLNRSR
jgi:hypothetical protein